MGFRLAITAASAALLPAARAAWGYTSSGGYYVVDTGSANSFTFRVSQSSCDITSLNYRGYQYGSQASHISSGLGSATFKLSIQTTGDYIKITWATSTLSQYLVAHKGDSTIYMATYTTAEPSIGELRFIARLNSARLTTSAFPQSYSGQGTAGAVEGSDVYKDSSGNTYSKFYSSVKFIDDQVHWVSTSDGGVHVSMVMPGNAYESSSGGPFFRDINSDKTSSKGAHNLYFYMNSGHTQTESYRQGLHGPYALVRPLVIDVAYGIRVTPAALSHVFSGSEIPEKNLDLSFFANLGISGYVTNSGRGTVKGTASGVSSSYQTVIHWYNSVAQYWTYAFISPLMKSGTYTMVLYKNELAVATQSVSVSAGGTTTSNIATNDPTKTTPTWIIGDFDGKPTGFLNADLQERMQPSDTRMRAWGPVTYTIGSSSTSSFPMVQIHDVNSPTTIKFTLSSSQTDAATLNSRGFTRGTYRGNNVIYEVSIPSGVLISGTNTICINVLSGSSGDGFLSPNFIYDAVAFWTNGGSVVTTTTTRTTTTSRTTTSTGSSGGSVPACGQCGGQGYSGATTCVSGYACVYSNDWYSQCLPN